MKIERATLRHLRMALREPFETSFGVEEYRDVVLVTAEADGLEGWGESVAADIPLYNEETSTTVVHMLKDFLIPRVLGTELSHPDDLQVLFAPFRRNYMAKAVLEGAVWDLWARQQDLPLARALGGTKEAVDVGISIGIQADVGALFERIEHFLARGYRRIKVKIKPEWDIEIIRSIRERFGDIPVMADANSAYSLQDIDLFREMDAYDLMMVEQPLAHDDIVDHATLQRAIETPVCLDESIHSVEDTRRALELGSCRIINIKVGRVGGLTAARRIHDLCREKEAPVWCGGMLETGIGRAHNIAIASLPGFTLPGDTAASSRYWERDIIQPEVGVGPDGRIPVPTGAGLGFEVDVEYVDHLTDWREEIRA